MNSTTLDLSEDGLVSLGGPDWRHNRAGTEAALVEHLTKLGYRLIGLRFEVIAGKVWGTVEVEALETPEEVKAMLSGYLLREDFTF